MISVTSKEEDTFKRMCGRRLSSVSLNKARDQFAVRFEDGSSVVFGVEGDCCSNSWIEHLELPGDIAGATLLSVFEDAPITSDHPEHDEENGGESIKVYNTAFRTDRGDIVLEYRNSSNGCYGGNLFLRSENLR